MRYRSNGDEILVGDRVIVEGNLTGVVVCDFDLRQSLDEFAHFLEPVELLGGGRLDSGLMVNTDQFGLMHFVDAEQIEPAI